MSGSDLSIRDAYVWTSTGQRFTFTDWHSLEPNHGLANTEFTINYWYKNNTLKWNDSDPLSLKHIICEQL